MTNTHCGLCTGTLPRDSTSVAGICPTCQTSDIQRAVQVRILKDGRVFLITHPDDDCYTDPSGVRATHTVGMATKEVAMHREVDALLRQNADKFHIRDAVIPWFLLNEIIPTIVAKALKKKS